MTAVELHLVVERLSGEGLVLDLPYQGGVADVQFAGSGRTPKDTTGPGLSFVDSGWLLRQRGTEV